MRLIDADAAKRKIIDEALKVISELNINTFAIVSGLINMFDCQDDFPTIEAEPVRHGEWLNSGINGTVSCSLCMFTDFFANQNRVMLFKYCPSCGAKMDGGDNST